MTGLLIAAPTVAYVVIALAGARLVYGRARIWLMTRDRDPYSLTSRDTQCVWTGVGLTLACLAGLWPLVLAAVFVMAKPPKTPSEMREQAEAQRLRIAELERELGVGRRS